MRGLKHRKNRFFARQRAPTTASSELFAALKAFFARLRRGGARARVPRTGVGLREFLQFFASIVMYIIHDFHLHSDGLSSVFGDLSYFQVFSFGVFSRRSVLPGPRGDTDKGQGRGHALGGRLRGALQPAAKHE